MEPGFKARLADCRVGIIGLGLMGGSIALALNGAQTCRAICGYDLDPRTIEQALDRGLINRPIDLGGDEVDLLILAVPVSAILDWLDRAPLVFSGAFHLLDLGSTKAQIVERMHTLPERISPLGGHPMCGKETSGLNAADGDLYRECLFVLTSLDRTQPDTLKIAQEVVETIHARSLLLDSTRHDHLAAAISHMPYLVAAMLVEAVMRADDDLTWQIAASGFRDTSRLAASDVTMMLDILKSNRAEVLNALTSVQLSLQETIGLIKREDWAQLQVKLEAIQTRRKWWADAKRTE